MRDHRAQAAGWAARRRSSSPPEGAQVCVADVDAMLAEETVSLCPGEAFAFARTSPTRTTWRAMYAETAERFGGVDVLYNNAGISPGDDAPSSTRPSRRGSACRT